MLRTVRRAILILIAIGADAAATCPTFASIETKITTTLKDWKSEKTRSSLSRYFFENSRMQN